MASAGNPGKIGIALDVDGTMFDTNPACYQRACDAWGKQYHGNNFPLTYEQFDSFRPMVTRAEDYFSFTFMMIDHDGKLPANARELNEKSYRGYAECEPLKKLFYDSRREKMADDRAGWCAENPVYGGVQEMMDQLGNTDWKIFIVTSKDKDAVQSLLTHYNLGGNIGEIYDKDVGKRLAQFTKASGELGIEIANIIPYDDLLAQLLAARSLGMTPVGAPQGYGIEKEMKENGFPLAWPLELVGKVEDMLRSR